MTKLTEYVTVTQAARIVGCTPNTTRKWGKRADISLDLNTANRHHLLNLAYLEKFLKRIKQPVTTQLVTKKK